MKKHLPKIALLFVIMLFLPAAQAQTAESCANLVGLKIPGFSVEITSAKSVPAEGLLPSHCQVEGVIEPRTGVDNVSYGIGFALALPDDWNGRCEGWNCI